MSCKSSTMQPIYRGRDCMGRVPRSVGGGTAWRGLFTRTTRAVLRRYARKIPYTSPPFWTGQLIALLCVAGGAGLRFLLDPIAHGRIPVVIFYPFVLIASIWGGTLAGLSTLIVGASIADYFWLPASGNTVTLVTFSLVCLFVIFVARLFRALVDIHVEGEARANLLTHEMNHRANNLLTIVQGISAQTARNATTIEEYRASFQSRLTALARAQRLVSEYPDACADLRTFLLNVIEPFGTDRFVIDGPASSIPEQLCPSFALLLHELGTNATKYGALSLPQGLVDIRWTESTSTVRLVWRELNGPPVMVPARTGFGTRLLRMAFPPEHGSADIVFDPAGVQCTVDFALERA